MAGVPLDLLWLSLLGLSMGEEKNLEKIKKKKKGRSRKREETERKERKLWRPSPPWSLP